MRAYTRTFIRIKRKPRPRKGIIWKSACVQHHLFLCLRSTLWFLPWILPVGPHYRHLDLALSPSKITLSANPLRFDYSSMCRRLIQLQVCVVLRPASTCNFSASHLSAITTFWRVIYRNVRGLNSCYGASSVCRSNHPVWTRGMRSVLCPQILTRRTVIHVYCYYIDAGLIAYC